MSDAVVFVAVFGGIFVLHFIGATVAFFLVLPAGDRCPQCDAPTFWIRKPILNRLLPWMRTSWCADCGWSGMLRHGALTPPAEPTAARSRKATPRGERYGTET